mgnify:CR=1 FL=1
MGRRTTFRRAPDDFRRGTVVAEWPGSQPSAEEVAARARYFPNGEHKRSPAPNGEWSFAPKCDKAKCRQCAMEHWREVRDAFEAALRYSIRLALVDEEFRGGFPARAWARINGNWHEARLTNKGTGEYHGFPLDYEEQMPRDPAERLKEVPNVTIAHY